MTSTQRLERSAFDTNDLDRVLAEPQSSRRVGRWFLLALALLAGVLWLADQQGLLPPSPAPARYRTVELARGVLEVEITATGNLAARNQVDVGSPQSGILKTVTVDFNDTVVAGQLLAQLDDTQIRAQVRRSEASLQAARARAAEAEATRDVATAIYNRMLSLQEESGGRMPSAQELDNANADVARSQAQVASARADVGLAEAALASDRFVLSQMAIYSPIDGVVLNRTIETGQTLAAAFQAPVLFTLAEDLHSMELLVDIDEADIGSIKEGMGAIFTVDSFPERRFPAEITQVRYAAENQDGVVTYRAVLNVDNPDLSLRPGMTATATLVVDLAADALLIPNEALEYARRHELATTSPGPGLLIATESDLRFVPVRLGSTNGRMTVMSPGQERTWSANLQVVLGEELP